MSPKYWEYFLTIESDLAECARYVEFDKKNYGAYSNEFARILVSAAAEIDTIMQSLCKSISPNKSPKNITEYHPIIHLKYPSFSIHRVEIRRNGLRTAPWIDWEATKSPAWWGQGYNKIKHDRTNNFHEANLQNAIDAVGALFLTIIHYHNAISEPNNMFGNGQLVVEASRAAQLFSPVGTIHSHSRPVVVYEIPMIPD